MELLKEYGKELISVLVTLLTWIADNRLKPRSRLVHSLRHQFTYLIAEPLIDQEGKTVAVAQNAHTAGHTITNTGKETATGVEVVFNWRPPYVNIWPSRHYEEKTAQDGRHSYIFSSLAPSEYIGVELISVNVYIYIIYTYWYAYRGSRGADPP